MSTVVEEIEYYKTLITEHRNRIASIEAQPDYNMQDAGFIDLIKTEQNLILAYLTAIHDLRVLQGKFLMVIMLCFHYSHLSVCSSCVLLAAATGQGRSAIPFVCHPLCALF